MYAEALAQTRWPGRAQVLPDAHGEECGEEPALNLVFHLDGAHTGESSAACAEWFAEVTPLESVRVLMFNCMKVQRPEAFHGLLSLCAPGERAAPVALTHPLSVEGQRLGADWLRVA